MQSSSRLRGRGGFSLLEVMVAALLVGLLLTILVRVSSTSYRIGHEEVERGALESKVLMLSKRLETDLLKSTPGGITLAADGKRVIIHPIDSVTASGRVAMKPEFVYWNWDQVMVGAGMRQQLCRSEISTRPDSVAFDGNAFRWTPAQLGGLPPGPQERPSVVANDVSKFLILNPAGVTVPQVGTPLTFEIAMELPLAVTRKEVRVTRTVQIRTSGN